MDQSGTDSHQCSAEERNGKREDRRYAEAIDQTHSDGSPKGEAAIDREIRKIQYFIGNVNTQCQDAVDHSLFQYA